MAIPSAPGRMVRKDRRYIILLLTQQPFRKCLRKSDPIQVDLFNPHLQCRRLRLQPKIARLQCHKHRIRIRVGGGDTLRPERLEKLRRRGFLHASAGIKIVFDLRLCHLLGSDIERVKYRSSDGAVEDVPLQHGPVNSLPRAVSENPEVASWKDVDGIVIDDVVAALVLPCAGVGAVDDVLLPGGSALPVVRAQTTAHPLIGEDVMHVIAPDDVAFARAGDVDPCSVTQFQQHALHLVVLDYVVLRVQKGQDLVPCLTFADLLPAQTPADLPALAAPLKIGHADAAQRDGVSRHVVNVVVGHVVPAALPHHQPDRMPVDQPAIVDMVVENLVLLVDILNAGPVSDQHDTALAHVTNLVAFNPVLLRVEIQPNGRATAVAKPAILHGARFGAAQADESVGLVEHLPVVLDAYVVAGPYIAVRMGKRQSTENKVSNWYVGGAAGIILAFEAD